ncbi:G-patch domain-containing protein, partial [Haematococcus lacustris]
MLVMPRLQQAVLSWEPRQETVAIHTWLHPWLEHLAGPLQQLYPGIRHKLYVALQVNPLAQDMAPFEWVMAWTDCLPEPQMVSLLEGGFFPQWKQ